MSSLTGKQVLSLYKSFLTTYQGENQGVSAALKRIFSGDGTATACWVSTTGFKVAGDLEVTGTLTAPGFGGGGADVGDAFVTIGHPSDLTAERALTGTSNQIDITDNGANSTAVVSISSSYVGQTSVTTLGTIGTGTWNGSFIDVGYGGTGQTTYTNGQLLIGNTTGNTLTKATLTAPAAGISITNGTGSITFGLANDLSAVEGLSSNGIATRTATDTWLARTMTGTASRLSITNGDGVSGNPTFDIDSSYVGQASITTLGTVSTGTWSATTVAVNKGGTGQTSYTDGQLLIGNTTGNTLTKATLTAPAAGISVTNGNGSITLGLANDLSAVEGLSSNGMVARTASDTWTTRTITGTASEISVSNGDGISGNPTLSIPATIDLSGKTWLKIPTGTGPTVDASGKIAIDTNTDNSNITHGSVLFHDGVSLRYVPSIDTLPTTDTHVLTYDGTNKKYVFAAAPGAGGGASTGDAFVTIGHPADLTAERALTGTSNQIDLTDGGANGAATLSISATLDLSGNTSVAIPSGAGGTTINAAGEVCVDTTSKTVNFYNGAAETTLDPERNVSITIPNPSNSEKVPLFHANSALTVTKISAVLIGSSTPSVTYKVFKGADLSAAGTAVVTAGSTVTSVTSTTDVTSFDSAGVTSGNMVWVTTTAKSGTVNYLHVTVHYTRDA